MMFSGNDIPSTIVCHFDELERTENNDNYLDISSSIRSSFSDNHLMDIIRSGTTSTEPKSVADHNATNQDLLAMKDMIASMRRNPELLNLSPVMQRACLTTASYQCRVTSEDRISPSLIVLDETAAHHCVGNNVDDDVKNEDLCAMKDMIASMRKNPHLLYQSPVMQKACLTTNNTTTTSTEFTNDASRHISPNETTFDIRRPLGTKFDPSTFPTLPLPAVARGVSIDKNDVKVTASLSPAAVTAPSSAIKMDTHVPPSLRVRPRSI